MDRWKILIALAMPDHLHLLVAPLNRDQHISDFSRWFKNGFKSLSHFPWKWQEGSFDRLLRSDESLEEKRNYIQQNPVRAGLVKSAQEWPYRTKFDMDGFVENPNEMGATFVTSAAHRSALQQGIKPHKSVLQQIKVGSVPYLNAKPLCYGMDHLILAPPSQLAEKLRAGELDAALVPVMECLENPIYDLVDGVGITCHGFVYSVILIHHLPLAKINSVALDPASKTSNQLLKIIVEKSLHRKVRYVNDAQKADAQLLIGDAAIAYRQKNPDAVILDLGQTWWEMTQLPFVFAVWALRQHPENKERAQALRAVAQGGLSARPIIAANPEELRYITESIRYKIDTEEKAGLDRFAKELAEAGVIKENPILNWL